MKSTVGRVGYLTSRVRICLMVNLTEEPWPSGQLTARTRSVVGWAYRRLVPERCGRDPLGTVGTLQASIGP